VLAVTIPLTAPQKTLTGRVLGFSRLLPVSVFHSWLQFWSSHTLSQTEPSFFWSMAGFLYFFFSPGCGEERVKATGSE